MLTLLLASLAPMPCNAGFRDPTQPAYPLPTLTAADQAVDNAPVLSAIWISPKSRRATINGVTAKQGQTIDLMQTSNLNTEPAIPADVSQLLQTAQTPSRSNTIKIISIHKNSVTINQNGDLKTLQLVPRPYKTPLTANTHSNE